MTRRLEVTLGGRGACKDNNTVGDAETAESGKKMFFHSFFHDGALTLRVGLEDD